MSVHYAILTGAGHAKKAAASIDVATDTPSGVQFTVFVGGIATVSNIVFTADPDYFVSSASSTLPNLYKPSAGGLALVRVTTVDGTGSSNATGSRATLRQRSDHTDTIQSLPATTDAFGNQVAVGPSVAFALGDLANGASLYLAAIGGAADYVVQYGSTAPSAVAHLDPFNVAVIPLTIPNQRVIARVITPGQFLFAMLAVDTGRVEETILLAI